MPDLHSLKPNQKEVMLNSNQICLIMHGEIFPNEQ